MSINGSGKPLSKSPFRVCETVSCKFTAVPRPGLFNFRRYRFCKAGMEIKQPW